VEGSVVRFYLPIPIIFFVKKKIFSCFIKMSGSRPPMTFTLYIPQGINASFPISYVALPAPQSQKYQMIQLTRQIQSTPDAATALGLGTLSSLRTTIVDQQGQVNAPWLHLYNLNSPEGTLAVQVSHFNSTTIPMSANQVPTIIIPDGESSVTFQGSIDTNLCSGYYFGAVGTTEHTVYADKSPNKVVVNITDWWGQ